MTGPTCDFDESLCSGDREEREGLIRSIELALGDEMDSGLFYRREWSGEHCGGQLGCTFCIFRSSCIPCSRLICGV